MHRLLLTLLFSTVCALNASAQSGNTTPNADSAQSGRPVLTLVALLSMQPGPTDTEGIGGAAPGIAVSLGTSRRNNVTLDGEVSTSLPISASLRTGSSSVDHGQMDTLASLLVGRVIGSGSEALELKVGGSFVLGHSFFGGDFWGFEGPELALTGGFDKALSANERPAAVVSARYSYVFRGDEGLARLGSHIIRAGVGIRWGQSR